MMDILAPAVHVEGFLQQKSAGVGPVRSLKKRWFVLRDQEFKMYNNPNEAISRSTCQDMIYIHDIQGVRKVASGSSTKCVIEIVSRFRKYTLRSTCQDMIYIHDIQGVRKVASGSSTKCVIEIVSRFRKYTLVAPNPMDQDKWVKAFHDAMRSVRMRSMSTPAVSPPMDKEDNQAYHRPHSPATPPEIRRYRMSAVDDMNTSSSQKKRLFSESWIGKKLSRKSESVDDELLDSDRYSRQSLSSDQSGESNDRGHIYDIVTEFKKIPEGNDEDTRVGAMVTDQNTGSSSGSSDEEVFEKDIDNQPREQQESNKQPSLDGDELYDSVDNRETLQQESNQESSDLGGDELYDSVDNKVTQQQESNQELSNPGGDELYDSIDNKLTQQQESNQESSDLGGDELYDSVAPDHHGTNTVEVVVEDDLKQSEDDTTIDISPLTNKVESVEVDESTAQAFEDPTYIEELRVDNGVEELRKMIRDSGLDFDDAEAEDDYERIEGIGTEDDDAPAMAKLREMLGTM